MATQALLEQVIKDLQAISYKNQPMFKTVEAATGDDDDDKHHKDSPHVQIRLEEKSSDEEEPELGERNLIIKVYNRDHSGGNDGTEQQIADTTRANYVQISEYFNDNYNYKAGGVYERAMWLDAISIQSPFGNGLYSFEMTYKVLLG